MRPAVRNALRPRRPRPRRPLRLPPRPRRPHRPADRRLRQRRLRRLRLRLRRLRRPLRPVARPPRDRRRGRQRRPRTILSTGTPSPAELLHRIRTTSCPAPEARWAAHSAWASLLWSAGSASQLPLGVGAPWRTRGPLPPPRMRRTEESAWRDHRRRCHGGVGRDSHECADRCSAHLERHPRIRKNASVWNCARPSHSSRSRRGPASPSSRPTD